MEPDQRLVAFVHSLQHMSDPTYWSRVRPKAWVRVVHGDKELYEKLGRNDLCPCRSGKRLQELLPASGDFDGSDRDGYPR